MSTFIIIAFILGGLILFAVEVFLVPGISVAGIGAVLCILYALYYAFTFMGAAAGWISVGASAIGIALVTMWFMRSKTLDRISLKTNINSTIDRTAERKIQILCYEKHSKCTCRQRR